MKILDIYVILDVISHFDIVVSKAALELQNFFNLDSVNRVEMNISPEN